MDPDGSRASAAIAWQLPDGAIAVRMEYNVHGSPIDEAMLGQDLRKTATSLGVIRVGYDPLTDQELVKYLRKAEKINGPAFAQASAQFANLVNAGRLRWVECEAVSDDLTWTARKTNDEGRFEAVRAKDDRPITAALAAIRAVWLASGPKPAIPRIY